MKSNFPKMSLLVSFTFLLILSVSFFAAYKTIGNNHEESKSKEDEWSRESLRLDEIKALARSIKIIEGERVQLETHFARSSDVVPFLDSIEEMARKVSATAEVTSVDVAEDKKTLVVGMKASGSFGNLYRLLTLLENSPYALEFLGVDLRTGAGSTEEGDKATPRWEVLFKMKLLSFVE